MPRVTLKASDVAAIIGKNRYKPRSEVFDEMWKKYSPETFNGKTKVDKARAALSVSSEAQKVFDNATAIQTRDSAETMKVFQIAQAKVNCDPKLNEQQKSEIIEHIRSSVYTSHGTRKEDVTATKVASEEGVRLTRDNSFYNYEICTIGDYKFVVTGKIDRIEEHPDGSKTLVEIKNRTNRLFKMVVEYEMIQIQVYLQMLGLLHARLVEQHNDQMLSHPIDRDEEIWINEIVPGLEKFCKELHSVFSSLPLNT